jgi:ribosome-associated protein
MGVVITRSLVIPESELRLTAVRSSGPGGQHVNKVNTRMVLEFDLEHSSALTEIQKRQLRKSLDHRVNRQGVLRLQAQRHRTQSANKAEVIEKFATLLQQAFRPAKARVPTKVPNRIRERRITEKKQRGDVKRVRKKMAYGDE